MFSELNQIFTHSSKEVNQSLKKLTDSLKQSSEISESKVFGINTLIQFVAHFQNFFDSQAELMTKYAKEIETRFVEEPRKAFLSKGDQVQKILQKNAEIHEGLSKTVAK